MHKTIQFEVCCGSTEDALAAALGGADRIELNSALFLGGLTPSAGTLAQVKRQTDLPVMAMVRPREGGFCYTDQEYQTMVEDARILLELGADGLVFGFLLGDGSVDVRRTEAFVRLCGGRQAVFSRAVDVCPDPVAAVRQLADLGVDRVLTSGGRPSAPQGAEMIRQMIALGGIEILPGAGINTGNVLELLEKTGADQVHASARRAVTDTSVQGNPDIFFGGNIDGHFQPENIYKVTDAQAVSAMKKVLSKAGCK